jgi:uncharacterized membrane protein YfcA
MVVRGIVLVVAGALAGMIGTAGGIMSLISYPALLAVGIPALPANVANIVAGVACWPGSAVASRPELAGRASWLRRWSLAAAAGGGVGAGLLLSTPDQAFNSVVPFLVAAGSLALLFQPQLSAWRDHGHTRDGAGLLYAGGLLAVSVYTGYFGAGTGVMMLALLLLTTDRHMVSANALKNMLVGAASVTAAAVLVASGPIDWPAVIPLAAGMLIGSMAGPAIARRIPAKILRWLVGLFGLGFAVHLWLAQR